MALAALVIAASLPPASQAADRCRLPPASVKYDGQNHSFRPASKPTFRPDEIVEPGVGAHYGCDGSSPYAYVGDEDDLYGIYVPSAMSVEEAFKYRLISNVPDGSFIAECWPSRGCKVGDDDAFFIKFPVAGASDPLEVCFGTVDIDSTVSNPSLRIDQGPWHRIDAQMSEAPCFSNEESATIIKELRHGQRYETSMNTDHCLNDPPPADGSSPCTEGPQTTSTHALAGFRQAVDLTRYMMQHWTRITKESHYHP